MASERTATFGIKIPVETNADTAASSVDDLRDSVLGSQNAVKAYQSTLRALRGDTQEVKAAKVQLKAAINAERDAISRSTLALGKQGQTLTAAARQTKDAIKPIDNMRNALHAVGGPAADLSAKWGSLTSVVGGGGAVMGLATAGFAALALAMAAVVAGAVSATFAMGKFILESGNELRTMNLFREAATGSAENAKAFGTQIEALGNKIPTPRKELNELSLGLSKALIGTRISGQGIVDTFNAVAQTSAAMGDSAGNAIQEVITRGKLMGRMSLGVNELQGTGVGFQDVAKQLASDLKIGIGEAQNQLFMGRVKLDDGAKALRATVEKRFASINLRRMLDLNVIAQKLKDSFQALTKDINIEPMLAGFAKLADLFSVNTVTGAALKGMLEDFGAAITYVFKGGLPIIETFFTQVLIEATKFEIQLLKLAVGAKETGETLKDVFGIDLFNKAVATQLVIDSVKVAFFLLKGAAIAVGVALAPIVGLFVGITAAVYGLVEAIKEVVKWAGKEGVSGIVGGIFGGSKAGEADLKAAGAGVAASVQGGFTERLEMRSPSKVFARLTEEGIGGGVEKGAKAAAPGVNNAIGGMVSLPSIGGASGGGGGSSGPMSIEIHMNFPNAKDGKEVQATLSSPGFKAELLRAFEELAMGRGVPIR